MSVFSAFTNSLPIQLPHMESVERQIDHQSLLKNIFTNYTMDGRHSLVPGRLWVFSVLPLGLTEKLCSGQRRSSTSDLTSSHTRILIKDKHWIQFRFVVLGASVFPLHLIHVESNAITYTQQCGCMYSVPQMPTSPGSSVCAVMMTQRLFGG